MNGEGWWQDHRRCPNGLLRLRDEEEEEEESTVLILLLVVNLLHANVFLYYFYIASLYL